MIAEKNTYRLFASFLTDEVISIVAKQRFGRITPEYALVYTNGRKPKGFIEIKDAECGRLTEDDKSWLFDCNVVIYSEYHEETADGFFGSMTQIVSDLEASLETEAETLKKGGVAVERAT